MSIYLKDNESGKVLLAKNAQEPKMGHRNHKHTWDRIPSVEIGGEECQVHYDSSWGKYGYFERDGKWYKVNLGTDEETMSLFSSRRKDFPSNYDILWNRNSLEKVSKSEYDEFSG